MHWGGKFPHQHVLIQVLLSHQQMLMSLPENMKITVAILFLFPPCVPLFHVSSRQVSVNLEHSSQPMRSHLCLCRSSYSWEVCSCCSGEHRAYCKTILQEKKYRCFSMPRYVLSKAVHGLFVYMAFSYLPRDFYSCFIECSVGLHRWSRFKLSLLIMHMDYVSFIIWGLLWCKWEQRQTLAPAYKHLSPLCLFYEVF